MKVRTRFAPSPTGFMHVGGVRTALFAWLTARHHDGEFILRIEDTDRDRHVEGSERHIIESLDWLGLRPDEGPYRQSERLAIYKDWAQKLVEAGRAYADPYSQDELEAFRSQAKAQKKPFLFRDHRPPSPPDWKDGLPLRFKSNPKDYHWQDEVMGELAAGPESVDDFILIKSDGFPTYNFAHIIDDSVMAISHVIRSQEFLPSMPKFLNLYEALEFEWPKFATLPYVLGPDGKKKLSKRDGAKDILDYRQAGYLPQALVSFLATLGWNDGTEQEIFSVQELIDKFDLGRVQHSGAKFDEQRLIWVNGHFIRELPLGELYDKAQDFWPGPSKAAGEPYKKAALTLVQDRLKFLAELPELTGFFFTEPQPEQVRELFDNPADKQLQKISRQESVNLLKAAVKDLEASDFTESDIANRLNQLLGELNTRPGILFAAVRIGATGSKSSPQLFGTLSILGKQKVLARLDAAISALED